MSACVFLCLCPSSQLLDCFAIPVVVLLSWFFLLVRYKTTHLVGAGLCLLGIGCMVGTDVLFGWHQGLGEHTHTYLQNTAFQIYCTLFCHQFISAQRYIKIQIKHSWPWFDIRMYTHIESLGHGYFILSVSRRGEAVWGSFGSGRSNTVWDLQRLWGVHCE